MICEYVKNCVLLSLFMASPRLLLTLKVLWNPSKRPSKRHVKTSQQDGQDRRQMKHRRIQASTVLEAKMQNARDSSGSLEQIPATRATMSDEMLALEKKFGLHEGGEFWNDRAV